MAFPFSVVDSMVAGGFDSAVYTSHNAAVVFAGRTMIPITMKLRSTVVLMTYLLLMLKKMCLYPYLLGPLGQRVKVLLKAIYLHLSLEVRRLKLNLTRLSLLPLRVFRRGLLLVLVRVGLLGHIRCWGHMFTLMGLLS